MKNESSLLCPIKRICSILNITQKDLSFLLCVSEGTVNRWSAKPAGISSHILNTLKLLEENQNQKKQIEKYHLFFSTFNEIQKDFIK